MIQHSQNTIPDVTFGFNPGLEFITAMYRVANTQLFDDVYTEYRVQQDPEVLTWLKQMRERLSPFMRRELDFFFQVEHSHTDQAFHQVLLHGSPAVTSREVPAILEQAHPLQLVQFLIEDITQDELRKALLALLEHHLAANLMPDAAEWRKRAVIQTSAGEKVLEALADLRETKQRWIALTTAFYNHAYTAFEPRIAALATAAVRRYAERFHRDPAQFFTDFLATDPAVYDKDVHAHVSVLTQFGAFVSFTRSRCIPISIRLGIRNEEINGVEAETEQVEKFCKVISDKNRLEIIRLLSHRSWYGQELAKQLQLSPAAITYHMGFFYTADLVTLKRADQRGYYELDKDRLRVLFNLLEKAINLK